MERYQLNGTTSYAKNKLQSQMCGKLSQIHRVHSLFVGYKNDLSWLNNLFMVRFQLIRMSSYAQNKLEMCVVSQRQCRRH